MGTRRNERPGEHSGAVGPSKMSLFPEEQVQAPGEFRVGVMRSETSSQLQFRITSFPVAVGRTSSYTISPTNVCTFPGA